MYGMKPVGTDRFKGRMVSVEMVATTSGLGWVVLDASRYFRSDIVFLGILIMEMTGVLLDRSIQLLERWRGAGVQRIRQKTSRGILPCPGSLQ